MKQFIDRFHKIRFTEKSVPFALLVGMLLAYGFMLPWLGFYQDDWHHIYYAYARGTGSLWELLNYDGRPFAAWVYVIGFSLLGFKPLAWQISTFILRWLTVTLIWAIFTQIWPERTRQNFTAALFFIIYPFFVIQPLSVAYALHWSGYLFYALSIWLMLLAAQKPRWFVPFTLLALLTEGIHLFTLEYFAGIELLRPLLLWFILSEKNTRAKIFRILRQWLPYLLIFIVYFFWRGFIYQSPVLARSVPQGLDDLLKSPFQTALSMTLNMVSDLVLILVSTWYELLTPDSANLNFATNILGALLAIISGALAFFFLWRNKDDANNSTRRWKQQALILGAAAVLLGILPAYGGGYVIHTKLFPWNARFAIGSLFGAGLLVTLLIEAVVSSPQTRRIVLALLIGLTIGWQVRYTNIFRHAWEAETDFYRQLTLRAPSVQPHTAFLAKEEFLGMMGDYPTSFALNAIYTQPLGAQGREARTWLFLVDSNFDGRADSLLDKTPLLDEKHSTEFSGNSSDSLVIMYEPEQGQCLWLVNPTDADVQIIPETLRVISPLSNPRLIDPSALPTPFLQTILPSQPDNWCTYYQRGSLAVQLKEWDKAVSQWEKAGKQDLRPTNGYEYLPFIESYGMTNNWPKAYELTRTANKVSKSMENSLCALWTRLQANTAASAEREDAVAKAKDYLGCK